MSNKGLLSLKYPECLGVAFAESAGTQSGNQTIYHGLIIRSDRMTIVIVITIETTERMLYKKHTS